MSEHQTETGPVPAGSQEIRHELRRFIKLVIALLVTVVLFRTFLFETWPVQGPSMQPVLQENDRIVVFKLPLLLSKLPLLHNFSGLDTGDLVVFETEGAEPQKLIKRLIAQGPAARAAEVVKADDGSSPYNVAVLFDRGAIYVNNQRLEEAYLESAERKSPDRHEAQLRAGEYYLLGDHRRVSKDSRMLGPIPERQIVGEAVFRIWPLSRFGRL